MSGQWHGGKGSSPRPKSISQEEYENRWEAIFCRDLDKNRKNEDGEVLQGNSLEPLDKEEEND